MTKKCQKPYRKYHQSEILCIFCNKWSDEHTQKLGFSVIFWERQEIQKYFFSNGKLIVKQVIQHLAFILCLLHWNSRVNTLKIEKSDGTLKKWKKYEKCQKKTYPLKIIHHTKSCMQIFFFIYRTDTQKD